MITLPPFEPFSKYIQKELAAHKKKVYSVDWNSSGSKLASASADSTIRVFPLESAGFDKSQELKGHTDVVDQISFHPENDSIFGSASSDKTFRIWDLRASKSNVKTEKTKDGNLNLAWSPDGNVLAVANKQNIITFFDYRMGSIFKMLKFDVEVNEIAYEPTGSLLMVTTGVE